jgi:hypothetical protein
MTTACRKCIGYAVMGVHRGEPYGLNDCGRSGINLKKDSEARNEKRT